MNDRITTPPHSVTSGDGTSIAYDRLGRGPPLVMIVGAFNDRFTAAGLAAALSDQLTVFTYDRRGRGSSGDTLPYAVEREIEDVAALIEVAGGSAALFGFSAGTMLALRCAAAGLPIDRLTLFQPPIIIPGSRPPVPRGLAEQVKALVEGGQRGEAVELFQTAAAGMPPAVVEHLRHAPFRPALEAMAHTLVYDLTIMGDASMPLDLLANVAAPTLVLDAGDGPLWIRQSAVALAQSMENASHISIPGLTFDLNAELLAPSLRKFLT